MSPEPQLVEVNRRLEELEQTATLYRETARLGEALRQRRNADLEELRRAGVPAAELCRRTGLSHQRLSQILGSTRGASVPRAEPPCRESSLDPLQSVSTSYTLDP